MYFGQDIEILAYETHDGFPLIRWAVRPVLKWGGILVTPIYDLQAIKRPIKGHLEGVPQPYLGDLRDLWSHGY